MNYQQLKHIPLFQGLGSSEISKVYDCFGGEIRHYEIGKVVINAGETLKKFGVVLGGQAQVCGINSCVVTAIYEGGYIGALLSGKSSPVTVKAADSLTVLFLPFNKLTGQCLKNCKYHTKVLNNFIDEISSKAISLYKRIDCLVKPTIREKVMAYFNQFEHFEQSFDIPFNREEMAKHLNVERSALSRELSKMKNDGLINFRKNTFKLL
jgi:CRP-like cAMP-binding protein